MSGQVKTPMHPNRMSDAELINEVFMSTPTEAERSLANRLSLALDYIEAVTEILRDNDLLDGVPVTFH